MPSFAAMEARIIAELHRDDVSTVAANYIQDAINHYQRQRFWFNETSATQSTVAGTATYAWPTDMVQCDSLVLTANGTIQPLRQIAPRQMDDLYFSSTFKGVPSRYADYQQQFRLYPTPDNIYTLTQYYLKTFTPLGTGSTSSNVWTTEAEELIRTRAKKLLWAHFVPTSADTAGVVQLLDTAEQDIFTGLQRRTQASTATGRLRAWSV